MADHTGPFTVGKAADSAITITINGDTGDLVAGGAGEDGDIRLRDAAGTTRISLDANSGVIRIYSAEGGLVMTISAHGDINMGGAGQDGDLRLRGAEGHNRIILDAGSGNIYVGGQGVDGDIFIRDESSRDHISFDGTSGSGTFGGNGANGMIRLKNSTSQDRIRLTGNNGDIVAGGNGADGDIYLKDNDGRNRIHLDAGGGNAWFGGHGADGDIVLFPDGATNLHDVKQATIHLDGQAGDIILKNADCAEEFDIAANLADEVEPGTVMVLDDSGSLCPCSEGYDRRVAGVVSGAGGYRPGIILDRQEAGSGRRPIALNGKVYCKVDGDYGSIRVGDLLTSSPTAGHAMKATDGARSLGTIIGKALEPLSSGQGLIPILVALQ